jgi:hypothetical protein
VLDGGTKLLAAHTGWVIEGLNRLAGSTGCDGIVRLDATGKISSLGSIIKSTSIDAILS